MKIEITEVRQSAAGVEVGFMCACGSARASWEGPAPQIGDQRVVEFDADDTLALGENTAEAEGAEPAMRALDGAIEVTALLQAHYPEEETVNLAFADGRIDLEVIGADWQIDRWYTLRLTALSAFDTNV